LYDKAQVNLLTVLASDERYLDKDGLVMTYNNLGNVLTKRKKFEEAERYLQKGYELAIAVNVPIELGNNRKAFAELYKAMGDNRKAIHYYDEYIALNDSIFTSQNATKIAQMNALYELEKKEQEIQSLRQREEMNKNRLQLQEAQIKYQNYFLFFTIGSIVLLLILVYMLYQYYRTKARANEKLRALNIEISEQKEEIQSQSEELIEANNSLIMLNHELIEKTEEIQAQSKELKETNAMITEINRDLDSIVTKRTSQLQEAYKELDTFFYRSSHDFRRPLTTFMGLAEVAKITVKDKSALELFSKVRDTAVSLDKMLVKLQSISDVGAQQLVYKEVLIKEIFETICDSFNDELEQFGILTESSVKLDRPFISYPAMVKIIIENLLENAIHFRSMEAPYISLNAYRHDEQVIIEIEDNGQGIRDEYKDRIFDMYFRANDRSKGNGLGLYIVKKAVQKLNGTIQLRTHFGKGSRFVITLPL
jgi:signal transduction histidine kinase